MKGSCRKGKGRMLPSLWSGGRRLPLLAKRGLRGVSRFTVTMKCCQMTLPFLSTHKVTEWQCRVPDGSALLLRQPLGISLNLQCRWKAKVLTSRQCADI